MKKITIKNKTVRKISLFINYILLIAVVVLSFYAIKLNNLLQKSEEQVAFFIAEVISRDNYMADMEVDPKQIHMLKRLKLPVATSSTDKTSNVSSGCNPSKNESVNELLNKHFSGCENVKTIWAIAQAESSGKAYSINKSNRNGSWDCGYLQVNTIHRNKGESKDAFCNRMHNLSDNIAMAAKVYKDAGYKFTPWVTFNNGLHLAYMK